MRPSIAGAGLGALLLLAGCGAAVDPTAEDRAITEAVRDELLAEHGALAGLEVETHEGIVYLLGAVDTVRERAEAERYANAVEGVRQVVSTIAVRARSRS